jgi:DNA-binding PucR family transcriptional regulator
VIVATCRSGAGDEPTRQIARALLGSEPQAFVVARHEEVVAIPTVYVRRGPRELRRALEQAAARLERNHGVRLTAGISSVCAGIAHVARGYGEAHQALRRAGGDRQVVVLDEIALLDYLADGADETARRLVPVGMERLLREDERQRGALSATLRAYADCDLNVRRAAQSLIVHPNTVHYRLRRVQDLTGRDPRRFAELAELTTALRLLAR